MRRLLFAFVTASIAFAFPVTSEAQFGDFGTNTRATTVKSSKSNTSDRMGGAGGKKSSTAKTTTVKSSKSNTSDRMGGGPGKKAPSLNPQPEPPNKNK